MREYLPYRDTKSGIYFITNRTNGHFYLGSTNCDKVRSYNHFAALRKGQHFNPRLQRAYDRDGEENVIFEFANEYPEQDLQLVEQILLDYWYGKPECYNVSPRVEVAWYGRSVSEETRRKISEAQKGRKKSPEQIAKMRGRVVSAETREKMRLAKLGKKRSMEVRVKLSESHKGMVFSENRKQKISKSKLGHTVSEATKRKIRESVNKVDCRKGKISIEERARMQEMFRTGQYTQKAIAEMFGCSAGHAGRILTSPYTRNR